MSKEIRLIRFDWAMKHILRDKANFDILEGFLSAVLQRDIKILHLLESEANQHNENDKFNRVDLLAENQLGEKLMIEIQNNREVHYLERLLYGTSKLIVDNMQLGYPYKEIKKVISINILYFFLSDHADDYVYYGTTQFYGIHSHQPLKLKRKQQNTFISLESSHIFPEYYLIEVEKFQDVIQSDLDEWIYLLKHESIREDFKAKHINKAKEKLDVLKLPETSRKSYERYMENLAIESDLVESAHEEGWEKGHAAGHAQGEAYGEYKKAKEAALYMWKDGLEVALISKYTGLSVVDIQQLLSALSKP